MNLALILPLSTFILSGQPVNLPKGMKCTALKARIPEVRVITIEKLNTTAPVSSLSDPFQEQGLADGKYNLSFSDECESWYNFSFNLNDLEALSSGQATSVKGVLTYNESTDSDDSTEVSCIAN